MVHVFAIYYVSSIIAEVQCPAPPSFANARLFLPDESTEWNAVAVYRCDSGFVLPDGAFLASAFLALAFLDSPNESLDRSSKAEER